MRAQYQSKFIRRMKRKQMIESGVGAGIWTALFFLCYFFLRATSYHVRYPNQQRLNMYLFLDQYLFLWWGLGVIITVLVIRVLIYHRMEKSFDVTLDFMKEIWNDPEQEITVSRDLEEIYNLINFFQAQLHEKTNAIKQEQQRKNDLVVYLAHDLKTPLTSVQGYLEILLEQPNLPIEMRQNYTEVAMEKAERLEELIDEFFEISRFNLTDIVIEKKEINLKRLLEQEVFEFEPMLREKQLSCQIKMESDFNCICDSDKMQRVIDNLLRNAANYSNPNTDIIIRGWEDDKQYYIDVENEGETIPKESLERLFEQFFRLDSSRNSRSGGSGVGLAIAKKILEAHGGSIEAKSCDGKICFCLKWPKSEN